MNTTSTHDTKRGEDVRARLNVLTEMPDEWDRRLELWLRANASKKEVVNGKLAPSGSEEILIYQTLLGAWPARQDQEAPFFMRVQEYLIKALREAKQNSSWIEPHEDYERAVQAFTTRIVSPDSPFLADFREFQKVIAFAGTRNSLSQLLLKIAAPGVPDFYQGGEFWQLSLVDPDNRRPVDFKRRSEVLESLRRRESEDRLALIRSLAADPLQDEMKLFVTYKALQFRKANRELFASGQYLPLSARGVGCAHVCSFARRLGDRWAIAIAPRWTSQLRDWGDTELVLPEGAPAQWQDALTGLIAPGPRLSEVLAEFPVALWSPMLP